MPDDVRSVKKSLSAGACASLVAAIFLSGASAASQPVPVSPAPAEAPSLDRRIAVLAGSYEKATGALVGLSVLDLRSGKSLLSIRPDRQFIPASCQKLLTGAFALARLGGNFRFSTAVYLHRGMLYVKGSYDPTLGDPRLAKAAGTSIYREPDAWAKAIKNAVGNTFKGDIIVAGSDRRGYRHPDWPTAQHARWYAAPIAPLNFYNNCFSATFTVKGKAVEAHVVPSSSFIRVVNRVKPGRRHVWSLRSSADESLVTLRGTVTTSTRDGLYVAVNDPPLLLGRVLADRMARSGVRFTGSVRAGVIPTTAISDEKKLAETITDLSIVLKRANKRSQNMIAEGIFLRAGDGSWDGSAAAMSRALIEKYGLDAKAFVVRDGGGLSRRNRITPSGLTRVLAGVAKRRDASVFLQSLPVSGTDGTMRRRLRKEAYRRRVLGKTGYISGVSCLGGYVLDSRGRVAMSFAVLVNGLRSGAAWKAKQLQDAICRLLVDELDRRDGAGR